MLVLLNATWGQIEPLCWNLRPSDLLEMQSAHGEPVAKTLQEAYIMSEICWVLQQQNRTVAVGGAAAMPEHPRAGIPWLLGSVELETPACRFWLAKHSSVLLRALLTRFETLENYVHESNLVSLRWLKKLGFTVEDPEPRGVRGDRFHRIFLRRTEPCAIR